jgi:L-fuconolactonase
VIVDSHQHFWRLDRGDYCWLRPSMRPLYKDFLPVQLGPILASEGVDATVLVQAAPTEAETEYLLSLARRSTFVRAVVGWTDLVAATAPAAIERLAAQPLLRGLRPMVQDEDDSSWLLQDKLKYAVRAMCDCSLTFDALVRPAQLGAVRVFADRFPDLPIVIDHAGKPDILCNAFDAWRTEISALSERPQVMCKLSGLLNEAGARTLDEDLRPWIDHLLVSFGPERMMWGSDWPVLNVFSSYGRWFRQATRLISSLSARERARVFGGTAAQFYRIASHG